METTTALTGAACVGHSTLLFVTSSESNEMPEIVKELCPGCSVREACLELGLSPLSPKGGVSVLPLGWWGGAGPDERKLLYRKRLDSGYQAPVREVRSTLHNPCDTAVRSKDCLRGHPRTANNSTKTGSCKLCNRMRSAVRNARDAGSTVANWQDLDGNRQQMDVSELERLFSPVDRGGFCKRGHDTTVTGLHPKRGTCVVCVRMANMASGARRRGFPTAKWIVWDGHELREEVVPLDEFNHRWGYDGAKL